MKKAFLTIVGACILTGVYSQNIGIGTNTPAEKLDITGNLNVSGTIKANAQPVRQTRC